MGARHAARQLAVQALYALDLNPAMLPEEALLCVRGEAVTRDRDEAYLEDLVHGAWQRRETLDGEVDAASHRWKLSRMDRVDVSVLRLAAYELLLRPDIPAEVVMDEGVELAKEFGTPDSPSFVNGILDRIARDHRKSNLGA